MSRDGLRALPTRARTDILVLGALSLLGVLGFETSFGDYNFLLAGVGGLIVGTGAAILGYSLRLGPVVGVTAAVLAYFLLGTPFTMPHQAVLLVFPSLASAAGLALGAVFGWADIVTLGTPVEAPYYMPVLPYFAVWLIAVCGTMLASRWLPRRPRTAGRASVLLVGPVLLYLAGILLGTDEAYQAGIRGVAFAVIALLWLGWRRTASAPASATPSATQHGVASAGRLLRRKLTGTAILIVGTILLGSLAGAALTPAPADRFVLREEIQPPFDPLQFPSPLAGFRRYTKTLADTPLFTVSGLKTGQLVRLASMDSYDGRLWNVSEAAGSGSAGFRLVGRTIPAPPLVSGDESSTVRITDTGYSDVWLPGVGYPTTVDFTDPASAAQSENLRYNAGTGTAMLTSGVQSGYQYTTVAEVQRQVRDEDLEETPVATLTLPPAVDIPDVVVAKASEFIGAAATPIDQLRAIQKGLKTQGFLSHGLASDGIPSRAGHGADRIDELFTRSQMVGDQEQYAAAMALMARSLNFPARVVMGFAPVVPDGAASVTVTGSDVTAWVEVAFQGVGWVPFFPTPDQTDVPQDQTPKPKSVPQPQVRQPPRTDNQSDNLLTAVEIDDTKKDDQDKAFVLPGWAWLLGGVLGIPLILLGGPLLAIAALKSLRRRRRRNRGSGDIRVAGAWEELADGYAELGFDVRRGTSRTRVATDLEAQYVEQGLHSHVGLRLDSFARAVDRAVFNGETVGDDVVARAWKDSREALAGVRGAVGRVRRLVSRFRIRSVPRPRPRSRDRGRG